MQQMINVDFVAAPLDDTPSAFGIVTRPPDGVATFHLRRGKPMVEIGELVVVDSIINVIPRRETGACHRQYLLGAAEAAVFSNCHEALGWQAGTTASGVDCWIRFISIPVDVESPTRTAAGPVALGLPTHWTP